MAAYDYTRTGPKTAYNGQSQYETFGNSSSSNSNETLPPSERSQSPLYHVLNEGQDSKKSNTGNQPIYHALEESVDESVTGKAQRVDSPIYHLLEPDQNIYQPLEDGVAASNENNSQLPTYQPLERNQYQPLNTSTINADDKEKPLYQPLDRNENCYQPPGSSGNQYSSPVYEGLNTSQPSATGIQDAPHPKQAAPHFKQPEPVYRELDYDSNSLGNVNPGYSDENLYDI